MYITHEEMYVIFLLKVFFFYFLLVTRGLDCRPRVSQVCHYLSLNPLRIRVIDEYTDQYNPLKIQHEFRPKSQLLRLSDRKSVV